MVECVLHLSNNTKHAHVEKPPTHSPTDTSAAYNSSPAATSHDYKEKLAALETSNAAEIQRLKKENEAEIAKLKNEFSSEIHKLKETHITQKDKLEHDYNDEIEKLRKSKVWGLQTRNNFTPLIKSIRKILSLFSFSTVIWGFKTEGKK